MKQLTVTFLPAHQTCTVVAGTTILLAAQQIGIPITSACGGTGTCGKCVVEIVEGSIDISEKSNEFITSGRIPNGYCLACSSRIVSDCTINTAAMQTTGKPHVLTTGTAETRSIPAGHAVGLAIDLGTTTIAVSLCDLTNGTVAASLGTLNPQCAFGDDIISRLAYINSSSQNLQQLQKITIAAINTLVQELCFSCKTSVDTITEIALCGNTAMQQIICGIDSTALGVKPYVPAFLNSKTMRAKDIGINVSENASLYIFPQIGGFVGGDIAAGLLAAIIDKYNKPILFIDIGTNGEIVLQCNGKRFAASTAAGPAFEGARIRHGMRAAHGAISKVHLSNGKLEIVIIGNSAPEGICGSGLVDAVATLLKAGIVDCMGTLASAETVPSPLPDDIRSRLTMNLDEPAFILTPADAATGQPEIRIHQEDIRQVQLGMGAIRAGIQLLLSDAQITADDLETVFIAGAFGNAIDPLNAMAIGLLPHVAATKIVNLGNSALTGAQQIIFNHTNKAVIEKLTRTVQHVELADNPAFAETFGMAMMFD